MGKDYFAMYEWKIFWFLLLFIFSWVPQLYSQEIRILLLGDSITDGEGLLQPDSEMTGYRQQLWQLLKSNGYNVNFVGSDSLGYCAKPKFDPDNGGFGGYSSKQLLHLLESGYGSNGQVITPGPYLNYYPADVILLHIGTNDLDTSSSDVEKILDYINKFEDSTNTVIWVIVAKIINEVPYNLNTTIFNNNLEKMVDKRIENGDKLKIVDMEKGAGLVYKMDTEAPYIHGDMYDKLHPNKSGYKKMGSLFYDTLRVLFNKITPVEFTGLSYFRNNKSTLLFWQTSLELNNNVFEIESSSGGNIWENLGIVKGVGNSHHLHTYYFIDNSFMLKYSAQNLFYRLKEINNSGKSIYLAKIDASFKNLIEPEAHTKLISQSVLTTYDRPDKSFVNINKNKSVNISKTKKFKTSDSFALGLLHYILSTIIIDNQSQMYFTRVINHLE
jgi:lysophospholipase L1-like esterase